MHHWSLPFLGGQTGVFGKLGEGWEKVVNERTTRGPPLPPFFSYLFWLMRRTLCFCFCFCFSKSSELEIGLDIKIYVIIVSYNPSYKCLHTSTAI